MLFIDIACMLSKLRTVPRIPIETKYYQVGIIFKYLVRQAAVLLNNRISFVLKLRQTHKALKLSVLLTFCLSKIFFALLNTVSSILL